MQQHAAAKILQSIIGMETQGEKRPRDEHAWTNDECLICREATGPFPVLNPACTHGYCPRCLYKKEKKLCDLCKKEWKYTYHAYHYFGSVYVVQRVDGGYLLCDDVQFFRSNSTLSGIVAKNSLKAMAKSNTTSHRRWMVQNKLIREKPVGDRVRKLEEAFGAGAVSKKVREDAWVVLGKGAATDTPNAAYVTSDGVVRVHISKGAIAPTNVAVPTEAMSAILAVFGEIEI